MRNYFQLLDIEERYDIDLSKLQQKYLALQAKYHPDRAIDAKSKNLNLSISIELNNAYKILTDNIKRAEYLLSLNGFNLDDPLLRNEISGVQLIDVWTALEIVEETKVIESLQVQLNANNDDTKQLSQKLSNAFIANRLQEAVIIIMKLKYLYTIAEYIKSKINLCK